MFIKIDDINLYYDGQEGRGIPILILHGWGASSAVMKGIFNFLSLQNKSVYSIDFAGFGKSDDPPDSYGVLEYAELVNKFINKLGIVKPIILGHSFGGRIAIILASRQLVSKLILVDAAGLKPKFNFIKSFKIFWYKVKKKLKLKTFGMGSKDYLALNNNMKKIFVRVVNSYLDKNLRQIKVPTLLIWGKNDTETPLYMAKKMNKMIADSGLVVLNNCGHFCFADNYIGFCKIINVFTN